MIARLMDAYWRWGPKVTVGFRRYFVRGPRLGSRQRQALEHSLVASHGGGLDFCRAKPGLGGLLCFGYETLVQGPRRGAGLVGLAAASNASRGSLQ